MEACQKARQETFDFTEEQIEDCMKRLVCLKPNLTLDNVPPAVRSRARSCVSI